MGREIRRVPPNWEHPRWTEDDAPRADLVGEYKSMHNTTYVEAARAWLEECKAWDDGTHADVVEYPDRKERFPYFWEWGGNPPDPNYYRPEYTEEATWWQVYQTVSEGYPVSPPFETPEELAQWLSENGDYWHQDRVARGLVLAGARPTYEQALRFVMSGWSPSFTMDRSSQAAHDAYGQGVK